ncbi:MAG: UvrD-helicase domain-containing protein [bacterium]|nr:UvrD-helicase domain-containing protein [bacterium]
MIILVIVVTISLAFIAYKSQEVSRDKHSLDQLLSLKKDESSFKDAVSDFQNLLQGSWYISDRQYQLWKTKYEHLAGMLSPAFNKVKTQDPFKQLVLDFTSYWHEGRKIVDGFNEQFVKQESPVIKRILSEKEIQNNSDQITAIASDEDNTLLVAGAGTGKTTTILGKLAYLVERVGVKPEEILLLSFTGRAVDELNERIEKKFPTKNIKALTFHSFGLSVVGEVLRQKPDLAFSTPQARLKFLNEQFDVLLKNRAYLDRVVEYFAYYFKPVVLEPGFKSLDDYYKYVKTEQNLTLRKEYVKSQQEVMIANFLYINGINYEYEAPYKHKTSDNKYRQYKPDFYLSDYDIYLEHFGVNRKGEVHFSQNETQNALQTKKYQAEMVWKRDLHKQQETKLVETFSYEFTERNWTDQLTNKLNTHNVQFSRRNIGEIFSSLKANGTVKQMVELFATFLDLTKSNGYTLENLQSKVVVRNNPRELAFFDVFSPIYQAYEDYLKQTNAIDFHDMLIKAASFINAGRYKANFRYIIIDEFQDFSMSKCVLVKALCDQNPDTKLFCVGDDWQSVFRFTGSDISLMTNFEESYGFTRKSQLVVTNRFNHNLATISNQFILKNPLQIKKEVRSEKDIFGEAVEIHYKKKADDDWVLKEVLGSLNTGARNEKRKSTVFLLGRYKHNKPEYLSKYQHELGNLTIDFLTVHSSKGSEADYVVVLDVISGKYGFPSEITDDPLLEIVLSKGDLYPHAEERRLMYVAMTRARHKVYIITDENRPSVFVLELDKSKTPNTDMVCQNCGGELVQRKGPYGVFYSCTNFPRCDYKVTK